MNTQFPLSLNQFDIYIDQMRWTDASHLNIGAVAKIIGNFHIKLFNDALNQVLHCHPGLRVRIAESEGNPCQIIAEYKNVKLHIVDFYHAEDSL